jgi:hypothetical protein
VAKLEISRFPRKEFPYMPGSTTTQDRAAARDFAAARVAFRQWDSVGILITNPFAALWLACTFPCQRFADSLTGACA